MLKPDGLMVYSTCSMSPHENEAVVAAVLHQYPELELVDVSDKLTGLKRMPGLRHWKVFAKDWTEMPSPDAEQNEKLQWSRTMWPPPEERAKKFNLERWWVTFFPSSFFFFSPLPAAAHSQPRPLSMHPCMPVFESFHIIRTPEGSSLHCSAKIPLRRRRPRRKDLQGREGRRRRKRKSKAKGKAIHPKASEPSLPRRRRGNCLAMSSRAADTSESVSGAQPLLPEEDPNHRSVFV